MDDEEGLYVEYNLECKICINTYKLFYVENTEDSLYRKHSAPLPKQPEPAVLRRFTRWWSQEMEAISSEPIEQATAAFLATFSLA